MLAELADASKRLNNLVEFVSRGQASDSATLGAAITAAEARVSQLRVEVEALRRDDGPAFRLVGGVDRRACCRASGAP